MRTDIKIDRKQVRLDSRKVSNIGYYKSVVQFGDLIVFKECCVMTMGRVIGRIAQVPPTDVTNTKVNDLVALALSHDGCHVMERWVSPDNVVLCYNPAQHGVDIVLLHSLFFGPAFRHVSVDTMRRWASGDISAAQCFGDPTLSIYKR